VAFRPSTMTVPMRVSANRRVSQGSILRRDGAPPRGGRRRGDRAREIEAIRCRRLRLLHPSLREFRMALDVESILKNPARLLPTSEPASSRSPSSRSDDPSVPHRDGPRAYTPSSRGAKRPYSTFVDL
jgi:hypothetical protein